MSDATASEGVFVMLPQFDFFFYIGSTYTYLAVNRVEEIAAR